MAVYKIHKNREKNRIYFCIFINEAVEHYFKGFINRKFTVSIFSFTVCQCVKNINYLKNLRRYVCKCRPLLISSRSYERQYTGSLYFFILSEKEFLIFRNRIGHYNIHDVEQRGRLRHDRILWF